MDDPALPPGYPSQWEADVVLRDGSVAHVRPIVPDDADRLRRFHAGQSADSIYLRFFAPLKQLSERDVHRFTHVDYDDRVALVVMLRGEIIGIGRYDRITPTSAEVAFNISDAYQGKGIGSVLLEHLADIARDHGVSTFEAEVLPQNRKMLAVFSDAGYLVSRRIEDGVIMVHFDIEPTEKSEEVRLAREHRAESVSLATLLAPKVIAVVGAGRDPGSAGHEVLRHLLEGQFTGQLYAVNPNASEILGVAAYPSVGAIPAQVDLAVIAVPAATVLDVVEDCAQAGVHGLVVLSTGFAEAGRDGQKLERRLLRRARDSGMRIIGPASFGVANTDEAVSMNASITPIMPPRGHLGLFAQSGPLGIAVLASSAQRRLGISSFVSAGNRLDVSGNDLMQYWMDDERTRAVGLYLESMGNPRKFSRIARRLAMSKPVIVVKSGVSRYGARHDVIPGHRVREVEVDPAAFRSMLAQAGVVHVDDIHQMFDVAQVLIHQPLPPGRRTAVVGNSPQLAALTAGAAEAQGLEITHRPKSVSGQAPLADFRAQLEAAFGDPQVDCVLVGYAPPLRRVEQEAAQLIAEVAAAHDKTCAAIMIGGIGMATQSFAGAPPVDESAVPRDLPLYTSPEDAARALGFAVRYAQWRRKDKGAPLSRQGIDRTGAQDLIDAHLAANPGGLTLSDADARALLATYGLDLWPRAEVISAQEAVAAAEELGYPVVVKSLSPVVRGNPSLQGMRLDLRTPEAVREAYESLDARLSVYDRAAYAVQRMAPAGIACLVTGTEDRLFGPVIAFSIGGPATDLLRDVAYRIPPLTDVDVRELLTSIRAAPLLAGYKGSPPVHREVLEEIVGRLSLLCDDMSEIAAIRLDPVIAHPAGACILGATIELALPAKRKDVRRRSLT